MSDTDVVDGCSGVNDEVGRWDKREREREQNEEGVCAQQFSLRKHCAVPTEVVVSRHRRRDHVITHFMT